MDFHIDHRCIIEGKTEESEKMQVMELAGKLGGDIEAAIRQLARERETETES